MNDINPKTMDEVFPPRLIDGSSFASVGDVFKWAEGMINYHPVAAEKINLFLDQKDNDRWAATLFLVSESLGSVEIRRGQ